MRRSRFGWALCGHRVCHGCTATIYGGGSDVYETCPDRSKRAPFPPNPSDTAPQAGNAAETRQGHRHLNVTSLKTKQTPTAGSPGSSTRVLREGDLEDFGDGSGVVLLEVARSPTAGSDSFWGERGIIAGGEKFIGRSRFRQGEQL